jgi:hypothetical protein
MRGNEQQVLMGGFTDCDERLLETRVLDKPCDCVSG